MFSWWFTLTKSYFTLNILFVEEDEGLGPEKDNTF